MNISYYHSRNLVSDRYIYRRDGPRFLTKTPPLAEPGSWLSKRYAYLYPALTFVTRFPPPLPAVLTMAAVTQTTAFGHDPSSKNPLSRPRCCRMRCLTHVPLHTPLTLSTQCALGD